MTSPLAEAAGAGHLVSRAGGAGAPRTCSPLCRPLPAPRAERPSPCPLPIPAGSIRTVSLPGGLISGDGGGGVPGAQRRRRLSRRHPPWHFEQSTPPLWRPGSDPVSTLPQALPAPGRLAGRREVACRPCLPAAGTRRRRPRPLFLAARVRPHRPRPAPPYRPDGGGALAARAPPDGVDRVQRDRCCFC